MHRHQLIVLTLLLISRMAHAQTPFGGDSDAMISRGIDHTLMSRFDAAFAVFDSVIVRHPDHPVGWFYKAATLQSKMMDYETDQWRDEFYALADSAEIRARRLLVDEENAWTQFYLGSTLSYKGLFQAKTGKIVGGFISAQKGLNHLEKAVSIDSTLADAYLGLGSYDYWAGSYYRYLKFLPWIRDSREDGIAQVKKAMKESAFSYYVALNSLGWIEYDQKHYHLALACFQEGLRQYPYSRFFLWGLADTYDKMENWAEASRVYGVLLASVRNETYNNGYNEGLCCAKLARCMVELARYQEAFDFAEALLKQDVSGTVKKRLKDSMKKARQIRQEALDALGRIEVRHE